MLGSVSISSPESRDDTRFGMTHIVQGFRRLKHFTSVILRRSRRICILLAQAELVARRNCRSLRD